ncbi:glycosyltransferase family 2 protein [Ottowia thiooxydans]|uniref:glycosyltransferase family 2 protein n=1 Tax=Ottowia thiooxydans TaxID=219182 RepID=UPI000426668D|nr:glycosyltransferase family 2 protein [Ottowia thiooxydans]
MNTFSDVHLSVIVPMRGTLADFERTLCLNRAMLGRAGLELVLVLGEPGLEPETHALMQHYADIQWTLLALEGEPGEAWRARAINAGVRHSLGKFVLVCGENIAFMSDVPAQVLTGLLGQPNAVVLGRCGHASVEQWQAAGSRAALFSQVAPAQIDPASLGALTGVSREALEAVGGYDESVSGDSAGENNLRIRLEAAGYGLLVSPHVLNVHISDFAKAPGGWPEMPADSAAYSPDSTMAASGRLNQMGPEHRARYVDGRLPDPMAQAPELLQCQGFAPWLAMRSLRLCPVCYRFTHYQAARGYCALCLPQPAAGTGRVRILGVIQVRNEAALLRGCLDHLRPYVDGFVILDDGSTDDTSRMIEAEPRLVAHLRNPVTNPHHWDEKGNKQRLLSAAKKMGADWVLVCDADERLEALFLQHLRAMAGVLAPLRLPCVSLALRELWDQPDQYRVDGVWGRKRVARFFALPDRISFDATTALHGPWYPDEVGARGNFIVTGYHMYHLRMIHAADRLARRDRYKQLDPNNQFQEIGYDYLTDESNGLALSPVSALRAYDMASLP